ncbi:LacI family DNA-binding transcriptional regulator [Streptomyces sp. MMS20-AI2-20]|uniref:LacI family DNA-binding transcriptional regulator n=1 Tax=Streptomyces sp. MMS20-AI2-20 TaxID=2925835 RepID=UPI0027E459A4|nr:LacI family DNA-binding transcriptional regulator [Streptomyces sp. MMS20-AI2-20]
MVGEAVAKGATLADVARRAGVSPSTVSRTLRGLPTVSPETRARVEEAARELSFAISRSASSLVTGRTGRVAVLVPNLDAWFLGAALAGMAPALNAAGLDMLVYSVTTAEQRAQFFDRLPARRNADALLVVSFALSPEERARLDDLGMPLVFVSQHEQGRAGVYVDDVEAARRGTRYLLNLGHRRIAYLEPADPSGFAWSSRARLDGYRAALAEAGIERDDDLVRQVADWQGPSLDAAVGRLLSLAEPPTAIFAETDDIAFRLLTVLRGVNVPVPQRMSILGFDGHAMAEPWDLSTMAQPARRLGEVAAELAHSVIYDPEAYRERHVVLPVELVPRGSTGPAPGPWPGDRAGEGAGNGDGVQERRV